MTDEAGAELTIAFPLWAIGAVAAAVGLVARRPLLVLAAARPSRSTTGQGRCGA